MGHKRNSDNHSMLALKYATIYAGKVEIAPKVPVRSLNDFSVWYTPGVAAVSKAIAEDPDLSFEYTWRWNSIAVITDGSRVLGLGSIGPEASIPVMEGKALIFKLLGGVDAVPIPISATSKEDIVRAVKWVEPAFGGINLEDIESPKCFYVLEELRKELSIPVWHDDQLGTAGAVLAALIGSLKLVGKKISKSKIVLFGAGASNIATARLLKVAGADMGKITMIDSKGILSPDREDMDELMLKNPWKYELAIETNRDRLSGEPKVAFDGTDVVIAASKPGPDVLKKDWIKRMADDAIVFVLANPIPEIWPWEAKEAGAKIVATGRSDFPNQVNNSLIFPSVFRGALEVRARAITDEMIIVAARSIAEYTEEKGLSEERIIASMEEWDVYPKTAASVAREAVRLGLARKTMSYDEILEHSTAVIERSRKVLNLLLRNGLVKEVDAGAK